MPRDPPQLFNPDPIPRFQNTHNCLEKSPEFPPEGPGWLFLKAELELPASRLQSDYESSIKCIINERTDFFSSAAFDIEELLCETLAEIQVCLRGHRERKNGSFSVSPPCTFPGGESRGCREGEGRCRAIQKNSSSSPPPNVALRDPGGLLRKAADGDSAALQHSPGAGLADRTSCEAEALPGLRVFAVRLGRLRSARAPPLEPLPGTVSLSRGAPLADGRPTEGPEPPRPSPLPRGLLHLLGRSFGGSGPPWLLTRPPPFLPGRGGHSFAP